MISKETFWELADLHKKMMKIKQHTSGVVSVNSPDGVHLLDDQFIHLLTEHFPDVPIMVDWCIKPDLKLNARIEGQDVVAVIDWEDFIKLTEEDGMSDRLEIPPDILREV